MELRDIQYFSAVAKHGHLGRAAEALGLSQSALSKSLRRLEQEMGVKLVRRTPKGVELTIEGATLASHAHQLRLSLSDVAHEVTDVSKGRAGHLRIGAGPGYAFHFLPAACNALFADAPNVTFSIKIAGRDDSLPVLRNGELDLVITTILPTPEHDLAQEPLYDDEYVVYTSASHRLSKKKQVTLADLAQERWALADPGFAISQHLRKIFVAQGLPPPRVAVETSAAALRLPLIASSDLVGYSSASMVRLALPHLRFSELRIRELALTFHVGVVYRKSGYLSPTARRFIEILKATARKIVQER